MLKSLSGFAALQVLGQLSVKAQVLALENSLNILEMDVSNSTCINQKRSRLIKDESMLTSVGKQQALANESTQSIVLYRVVEFVTLL